MCTHDHHQYIGDLVRDSIAEADDTTGLTANPCPVTKKMEQLMRGCPVLAKGEDSKTPTAGSDAIDELFSKQSDE